MELNKTQKMWVVVRGDGSLNMKSQASTNKQAIENHIKGTTMSWEYCMRVLKARCIPVEVTIKEIEQ